MTLMLEKDAHFFLFVYINILIKYGVNVKGRGLAVGEVFPLIPSQSPSRKSSISKNEEDA